MSKHKSSSSHHPSSENSERYPASAYSNTNNVRSTSGGSHHHSQHTHYNPEALREPSSVPLTPSKTIFNPLPPLPQQKKSYESLIIPAHGPGTVGQSGSATNSSTNGYNQLGIISEGGIRSNPSINSDHHDCSLPTSAASNNTSFSTPYQSLIPAGFSGPGSQPAIRYPSAAAAERAANNIGASSRSSSSSSQSSQNSYPPFHSLVSSTSTQLSSNPSIRSSNHPHSEKKSSLISRPSIASFQSHSPTPRASIYDDSISFSSRKSDPISIQRPKDDAEIEKMFIDLMVCFFCSSMLSFFTPINSSNTTID